MITPSMAPFVVDLARAKSVAVRLGAQSIAMDSPEMRIGTVTGDPSSTWAGELQGVTASDVTFGLKTLRARKLVTLLFASDEWLMDAVNGASLLENIISNAMAAELDKKILIGSGAANEPQGIANDPDRLSITGIGAISDYVDPVDAVARIMAQNYQGPVSGLGWVLHPTIAGDYQLLVEATTNAPLAAPMWVNELQKQYTTSLGTGTAIVGDFSQVLIGTRMNGMRFEIIDAGSGLNSDGDTLNAVTQVGRWIRMTWYGDSVVLRPTFFCSLEGITT
jgi:HK97 family phage major capsid protein